nr:ribonuclease H-like domain-containing protein [Tanacetum cinerariifolium]
MFDEYNALIRNKTWTSVHWPEGANIVRCMWLFRHKFLADGTLSRYKARLVANGSTQVEGVHVDETFSPVVKLGTIRTVLSLAISRHWLVHQLDVKNTFLHGDLAETVYMHQPSGILVTRDSSGMFLSQRKYAIEILELAHMVGCNPSRTPIDTESKLGDGGTLVCLYVHDLREPHFFALKRILWYVQGTLDYGLQLFSSTTDSLIAYSDSDSTGCPTTPRSTSGYCVFLGNNLLSWSSKRQPTLSRSSAEADAVYLSSNLVQHQRTKHIEIDIHFVWDLVATGPVRVLHVPSPFQYADIFTKSLPSALFDEFHDSLSVRCTSAPTA